MKVGLINNVSIKTIYSKKNYTMQKNKISFGQSTPQKSEFDILIKKRQSLQKSIEKLENDILRATNYNEQKAKNEVQVKIQTEVQAKGISKFGGFLSGEIKDIEDKYWEAFYTEKDIVQYLRTKLKDMQEIKEQLNEYLKIINEKLSQYQNSNLGGNIAKELPNMPANGVRVTVIHTEAKHLLETFDSATIEEIPQIVSKAAKGTKEHQQLLLSAYNEKSAFHKTLPEGSPERLALGKKLATLRKQMTEQNISFIQKAPESFASEQEKWDYLYTLYNAPKYNEATIMDYLDQFEKFGGRMYDKNTGKDSLPDVGTVVDCFIDDFLDSNAVLDKITHKEKYANREADDITKMLNRVVNKYIDIISKFATTELPEKGYSPDSAKLLPFYNHYRSTMTKDTVIKFINAFKNIAVDKQEYKEIRFFLKEGTWDAFYPELKAEDMPDIQKALDEFAKVVENLPEKITR